MKTWWDVRFDKWCSGVTFLSYYSRTTDAQWSLFSSKFKSFGLGQTNWAEILWCILVISSQTIGAILALWVPCSWESVAGFFFYNKHCFLGLKHTAPKYNSQNKIWAVKNLEKSLRTSVFGVLLHCFVLNKPLDVHEKLLVFGWIVISPQGKKILGVTSSMRQRLVMVSLEMHLLKYSQRIKIFSDGAFFP